MDAGGESRMYSQSACPRTDLATNSVGEYTKAFALSFVISMRKDAALSLA